MKTALLALVLAASIGSAYADTNAKCGGVNEFVLVRHLYVETVTCTTYFATFDYQANGQVKGDNCSITGALPSASPGVLGNVTVAFNMSNGQVINLTGCRIDGTTVMSYNFSSVAINCTEF